MPCWKNHIPAGKGSTKPDGTHVKTIWGELAWQLGAARGGQGGAREAFGIVADADATRSNPGAALHALISAHAPCLILIDEWVAYARQLYGRDDLDGGSFDTQFTFAQTLTEAVAQVPGAMLVVSIPASSDKPSDEERERGGTDIEVGGRNGGQEALARLQQVIRRVADPWRPAASDESFEIIRRRCSRTATRRPAATLTWSPARSPSSTPGTVRAWPIQSRMLTAAGIGTATSDPPATDSRI